MCMCVCMREASWPAIRRWTQDKLSAEHGDLIVHAGGLEFALKVSFFFSPTKYCTYMYTYIISWLCRKIGLPFSTDWPGGFCGRNAY